MNSIPWWDRDDVDRKVQETIEGTERERRLIREIRYSKARGIFKGINRTGE